MQDTLHRTLIIRLSSVGDIVLSSLVCRALRRHFPASHIDYLVKAEYADLVRYNPHLSRVLEFPAGGSLRDVLAFRTHIAETGYDLIIDLHDSLRSRMMTAGRENVRRIRKRKLARFLLVKLKVNLYDRLGGSPGVAERYLETVDDLGVSNDGEGLELFMDDDHVRSAAKRLGDAGMQGSMEFIGVCPSARHANKMWLKERFAETAVLLASGRHAGVLLFGSAAERDRCGEILGAIRESGHRGPVLNLSGTLSLLETAALMDRCTIVITNDSGLMHIAAARKRRTVAIFGPTVREFGFFPYGTSSAVVEHPSLSCRPCTHIGLAQCPLGHFRCMKEISTDTVVQAAQTLLAS
jgi:lipopolysaccharide heptosyltransferase II